MVFGFKIFNFNKFWNVIIKPMIYKGNSDGLKEIKIWSKLKIY